MATVSRISSTPTLVVAHAGRRFFERMVPKSRTTKMDDGLQRFRIRFRSWSSLLLFLPPPHVKSSSGPWDRPAPH
eukprot:8738474-Pyramimonas_sp.AAC.1